MKKNILFLFFLLLLFSCKSETDELLTISLSADKVEAVADDNDAISFVVTASNGEDVTLQSEIYVDNNKIAGSKFSTATSGNYTVSAKYKSIVAKSIQVKFKEPLSITISADVTEALADGSEFITFTVLDNENRDITSESHFFVDDILIDGNTYSSIIAGTFNVTAKYDGATSEAIQITFEEASTVELAVIVDKDVLFADGVDRVILSCINLSEDIDITQDVTFYVNDEPLSDNIFKSSVAGSYQISAKYEKIESPAIQLFSTSSVEFSQRIFAELVAATWCPYCPDGLLYLDNLKDNPLIIPMTIHVSNSNFDPFAANTKGVSLYQSFGVKNIPTIIVDRNIEQKVSPKYSSPLALIQFNKTSPPVGIAIESKVAGDLISGKAFVSETPFIQSPKIVVMLAENELVYDQRNNVKPDLGNPIKNFVHNSVYRDAYNDILGQPISASSDYEFEFVIAEGWNVDNLQIIVLVTNEDGTLNNAQKVKVGNQIGY